MNISKDVWEEILDVLKKHKISYETYYDNRYIRKGVEYPGVIVQDKHIWIRLIIPDYFEELKR